MDELWQITISRRSRLCTLSFAFVVVIKHLMLCASESGSCLLAIVGWFQIRLLNNF
jgi:hypothetical protein